MVMRNVLYPKLVIGKHFVLKRATTSALCVEAVDGNLTEQFVLHRKTFQFDFHVVKMTVIQFPVRLAFASTVQKDQGQTYSKFKVDLRWKYCSLVQLYVALYRLRNSGDILLIHNAEDKPQGAQTIHPMPISVAKPVFKMAVQFAEGKNLQLL